LKFHTGCGTFVLLIPPDRSGRVIHGGAAPTNRLSDELAPSPASRRHAGLLVGLAGLLALVAAAAPLAGGVLGALVLAVLVDTPYRKLSARVGPSHAAALTLVASLLLVFVPALVIGDLAWLQLRSLDLSGLTPSRRPWQE
jgi:hypothetical protein